MPHIILSNAAHTAIRRSTIREMGIWTNEWSRRVPGTNYWEVELSLETIQDVMTYQLPREPLSDTIIRMFAIYDRRRNEHHASHSRT